MMDRRQAEPSRQKNQGKSPFAPRKQRYFRGAKGDIIGRERFTRELSNRRFLIAG